MPQADQFQAPNRNPPSLRQAYHRPHTSLGAAGHWVKTAGILAPLVIAECIKDPAQKWRAIRIAAVATALLSEAMWTHKISQERKHAREREHQLTDHTPG